MATLTTEAKVVLKATHVATAASTDLAVSTGASAYVEKIIDIVLANGTGAGKADLLFSDQRTLTASSTENLDLAGGVTDFTGATFSFVKVKLILVTAATGNTNSVVVGAAGSNQWVTLFNSTGTTSLAAGEGFMAWANPAANGGWGVTASTGDLLKVANSSSGSSVTYDIVIIGTSA